MDGMNPNKTAMSIQVAQAPAKQAIAQQVHALSNATAFTPLVSENLSPAQWKIDDRYGDGKLATLANNINLDMNERIDEDP